MFLVGVSFEQRHILVVGFPRKIEKVADERNEPRERVDRNVEDHAELNDPRHSEIARLPEHPQSEQRRDEITKAGYQAENRVETESKGRAGHGHRRVEHP